MEHALSQFTLLPQTKSERALFVDKAINEVLSGARNPLELEIALKNVEETVKAIRANEEWKEAALDEAHNYPEKSFDFQGVKITKTARKTYNFSGCGDSSLASLIEEETDLKSKVKLRKEFLKTLQPGMDVVDGNTGEILQPPTWTATESLTFSFPK